MKRSNACCNRKKATIRDVAMMVGVTPGTVSHAFSGKRAISDKVRRQVFDAARKLDYQPNIIAQAMRNKATGLIGILIDPAGLQKKQMRLAEIVTTLQMNHYDTIIGMTAQEKGSGNSMQRLISGGLIDGMISLLPKKFDDCPAMQVPVIDAEAEERSNYRKAAGKVVNYFRACGHCRIGCIAPKAHIFPQVLGDVLEEKGIWCESEYCFEERDSVETGMSGAERLIGHQSATAVIVIGEAIAEGVYRWASLHKIPIPARLSLIGVDMMNEIFCRKFSLTTIRHTPGDWIQNAVNRLLCKINRSESMPDGIYPELIIRGSVASAFTEFGNTSCEMKNEIL